MLPTIRRRGYGPFYLPGIFDDDFFPVYANSKVFKPAVNIREDNRNFILDLAVPGMDKKDIRIDLNEDVLTISSETRNESEETSNGYKRREFTCSSFFRSFQIPENVNKDKIDASYKDGILIITLPKMEEEKHKISRRVKVS
ncbi:MAG: Hsp20/alpha crystallin family protein [Bacteroidales bacterium]|nr:Hsp20/alpha crystallin family protein [Bacteroidales bacterium]